MPTTLIQNGRVIDPSQDVDRVTNVLLRDGKVVGFDAPPGQYDQVIDAAGKIVTPGLAAGKTMIELSPEWEQEMKNEAQVVGYTVE